MDSWSVTQYMIISVADSSQIAKKIFESKVEARPVHAGSVMAFKYSISFATTLAAHFGCTHWLQLIQDHVRDLF